MATRTKGDGKPISYLESFCKWAVGLGLDTDWSLKATGMPQPNCKMRFAAGSSGLGRA